MHIKRIVAGIVLSGVLIGSTAYLFQSYEKVSELEKPIVALMIVGSIISSILLSVGAIDEYLRERG